ncbi:hypothetical protein [Lutimaribacter saemankumensis]|uniref:hypothetical protein n=1 Tax=Lutimaribacter saemankumensis TaxID=490829 RepID=UPI0015870119|nr:hypothetical protein [Lutimaribacter saemankumensis]
MPRSLAAMNTGVATPGRVKKTQSAWTTLHKRHELSPEQVQLTANDVENLPQSFQIPKKTGVAGTGMRKEFFCAYFDHDNGVGFDPRVWRRCCAN